MLLSLELYVMLVLANGAPVVADRSDDTRRLMRSQHLPILNKPVKPNRLRALLTSLLGPVS